MLKKILTLSLFILIILSNFCFLVYNQNFYSKNINSEYKEEYQNVINYLKGEEPLKFFNEKENLHMKDVKTLIQGTFYLFYLSIISTLLISSFFVYKKQSRKIISALKHSSIAVIIFSSIIALLSLISFDKFFIYFHKALFTNNLWVLDPSEDLLINIFTKSFFINFTKKLILNSLILSIIILLFTQLTKTLKKDKIQL